MIYKTVSKTFLNKFNFLIASAKRIAITGHFRPDDDAVGSTLALQYYLQKRFLEKKFDVIFTGNRSDRYQSFTNYDRIIFVKDLADEIDKYDLIIFCDGSQYSRFSNKAEIIISSKIKKICLDHHQSPPDKFDLALIEIKATSTSEIAYDIIGHKNLDAHISETLLLGILGDTGTFNYIKPGQYHIFSIVQKILEAGSIEIQEFKSRYNLIDPKTFDIIREFIKNSSFHEVNGWPDFQVSYVDRKYLKKHKISDTELSEASEIFVGYYIRLISGYSWGFSVKPYSDNSCSISFRSLPKSVSVRLLTEKMVIGGGHDRAAGGKIKSTGKPVEAQEAIDQIINWMKHHRPVLI